MEQEKKLILLVEDETIIAFSEKATLEKYGYAVRVAASGKAAVEAAETQPEIDLILMDIDLGRGMSGTEAAAIILERKDIPVVFLSSHTEAEIVKTTEAITSYGYVVKNSGIVVLDASIKMALRLFEANERLAGSEEKFRGLFETMSAGVIYQDASGKIIEANPAASRILGLSADRLIGVTAPSTVWKSATEDDIPLTIENQPSMAALRTGTRVGPVTIKVLNPERNAMIWLSVVSTPVFRPGETSPYQVYSTFDDITERKHAQDTLQANEHHLQLSVERYRRLFDNMKSCVAVYRAVDGGQDFTIADFNAAAETTERVLRENIVGKRVTEVFPGVEAFGILDVFRRVFRTGEPERMDQTEYVDERISGWRENYIYKLSSQEIVAIYDDVTERKRADEALRASEESLSVTLRSIGDGVIATDTRGRVENINPAAVRLCGYSADQARGKPLGQVFRIVDTESRRPAADPVERVLSSGKIVGLANHTTLIAKDGTEYQIADSAAPIRRPDGTVTGVVLVFSDVTEKYLREQTIRTEREQLLSIFNGIDEAIYISDPRTYEVLYMNSKLAGMLPAPNLGAKCFEQFHGLNSPCDFCTNHIILERKPEPYAWQFYNETLDRHFSITDRIIRWPDGRDVRFEMAIDITERVRAENEIKRQLAEKEVILKEVHHRIKNNIASIEAMLSMQAETSTDPEIASALHATVSRVQSMRALYEKLLIGSDYHEISLKHYLESLIDALRPIYTENTGIVIETALEEFAIAPKRAVVVGIIFNELLTNTFKYAFPKRDDGTVAVDLEKSDTRVTLTIRDTGIGFDERTIADSTPGFGLTIVRVLTEQLGGTYSIESDHGTKSMLSFDIA